MNVISSGPHILLFERDQQLVTLLSGELALAGYEVHIARTAVEVFDAIARFSVRLVMVDLAQAQAGRREFWVALDAQRRGRGVQVFTFRCTNVAGYGPDDPDEHVETVSTDLEVDGMAGVTKLVEAVRARVPGTVPPAPTAPVRPAPTAPSVANAQTQPVQGSLRSYQPQDIPQQQPTPAPTPARTGLSTFTDKIRAVIYPGGRHVAAVPEPTWQPNNSGNLSQHTAPFQQPDVQPRSQANPRSVEAEYPPHMYREDTMHQASSNALPPLEQTLGRISAVPTEKRNAHISAQNYPASHRPGPSAPREESSLDQLSRMLHDKQSVQKNTLIHGNGNTQHTKAYAAPGLEVDQQELQAIRAQILRAAQLDEAYERANASQPCPGESQNGAMQLRASPIQDMPFEREIEYRRATTGPLTPSSDNYAHPTLVVPQPTQPVQRVSSHTAPVQASPAQTYQAQSVPPQISPRLASSIREQSAETSFSAASYSSIRPTLSHAEISNELAEQQQQASKSVTLEGLASLPEQIQTSLQQHFARRPEVTASDDLLLDIVKSLPPMAPPPPIPQPPPVLNGRATRSLGSVLLEGHLVPEERLRVAQHVQRMMRGVDLNYQLGEILLMFKLLTPDQLLAASLVSYGMISTMQISALGRIRQELHAIGLEYDLESLVILFRILTPEQMREVRASWSS